MNGFITLNKINRKLPESIDKASFRITFDIMLEKEGRSNMKGTKAGIEVIQRIFEYLLRENL